MNKPDFEKVVDRVIETLPSWVLDQLDNLYVVVENRPPPGSEPVLGVYQGVPLKDRGSDYWGALPDRIVIYMEPHLALGLGRDQLEAEIRKTVLHEIGHHLGIDDRRLTEIGWD